MSENTKEDKDKSALIPINSKVNANVIEKADDISLGQWFWVKDEKDESAEKEWLGCVVYIGSNYLEIRSAGTCRGYSCERIHFDKLLKRLRPEPNHDAIIQGKIAYYQSQINQHLADIRAITSSLGVSEQSLIPDRSDPNSTALVVLSGISNVKKYQKDLVKARDRDLPDLFDAVKRNSEILTGWLNATSLPLEATVKSFKGSIAKVEDRIFNVSLYAGLTEDIVECCDGPPAAYNEKLRVMQRRLYMDEECLLNYRHGGMEFKDIGQFDKWICEPENKTRILPFPRCLVAMKVRRHVKEREYDGKLITAYINFELAQADKLTFLYMRNGEQIFRLSCDLDFGEMIFPDKALYDPGTAMMIKTSYNRIDEMITQSEYEVLCKEHESSKIQYDEWEKQHPDEHYFHNPFRDYRDFNPEEWSPFDQSNVYFDDCMASIAKEVKLYNRIAMIIQGLLDRSSVLHPHAPAKLWTPDGFNAAIELIRDGSVALYAGIKPNFQEYKNKCNSLLSSSSVVIGQELCWMKREAEKENDRCSRNWRMRERHHDYSTFKPYGDPGPGYISKIFKWHARSRKAVFVWHRKRRVWWNGDNSDIKCTITVPAQDLFNVSAYKLGDYKQFFQDPRTRAGYLQWAPLLLTAEEYLMGNIKV